MAAWLLSLGWLVKRELFRSTGARLAEAALSVPPGALFYRLDVGGQQVGFSSATLDTVPDSIRVEDLVVIDVPVLGRLRRTSARSVALLTRALRLQRIEVRFDGDAGSFTAQGQVLGDTILRVAIAGTEPGDSQVTRIPLTGPVTLPTLLPLRIAFGEVLAPGREYSVRLFDPPLLAQRDVRIRVAAESTLVVADSADLDSTTMAWVPVHFDTVRAFRLDQTTSDGGPPSSVWIDAQGRVVRASSPVGYSVERSAFEIAYENFRRRDTARVTRASAAPPPGAVVPATLLAAGVPFPTAGRTALRVRLGDVDARGFALSGGGQTLDGDVLTVVAAPATVWRAAGVLPAQDSRDSTLPPWLAPEPLIQARDPRIVARARQIVGRERNAGRVAERLARWVHDNIRPDSAAGVPGAVHALAAARGDANAFATLYVALARAAGLPARTVAGLVYVNDRFYYHAWPEVRLQDWVPVDPMLGQFPADAAHLRFTTGGLARHIELVRQIGRLKPEVL